MEVTVTPGTEEGAELTVVDRDGLVGTELWTDVTVVARGWLVGTDVAVETTVAWGWLVGTEALVDVGASKPLSSPGASSPMPADPETAAGTKAGAGRLLTDWAPARTTPPKTPTAAAARAMAKRRSNMVGSLRWVTTSTVRPGPSNLHLDIGRSTCGGGDGFAASSAAEG
jgi:hypothetical protein